MQVARFESVTFTGLCMSFAIKDWHFRGVFGGFEVAFDLWYGALIEFSLWKR